MVQGDSSFGLYESLARAKQIEIVELPGGAFDRTLVSRIPPPSFFARLHEVSTGLSTANIILHQSIYNSQWFWSAHRPLFFAGYANSMVQFDELICDRIALIFLSCSSHPGSPPYSRELIRAIALSAPDALVVVDELGALPVMEHGHDYSSVCSIIQECPNVVVLQPIPSDFGGPRYGLE